MKARRGPEALSIRRFNGSDADYDTWVANWNALWPDEPASVEGAKYGDSIREPKYVYQKLIAEIGGRAVGTALYQEPHWSYAPGKYDVQIRVFPEHQRRGIGSALYEYVMELLNGLPNKPVNLHADAREDQPHSAKFLTDRGFEQKQRQQVSRLDLASFDAAPFAESVRRFDASGLIIRTLEEFRAEDPDALRKTHEKFWEFFQDVPFFEEVTEVPLERFEKEIDSPSKLEGGFLLAFDGDEIVGTTSLWKRLASPGSLNTGLTAVARSQRRKGIATALKVRAILHARSIGVTMIQTDNEENNPMYELNVRLGFKPVPAWLLFQKLLGDGTTA
jgi:mycothiol synthase